MSARLYGKQDLTLLNGAPIPPILVCEVGSTAHGCSVDGHDDLDLMGLYVETREQVIGMHSFDHWIRSTGNDHSTNTADDVDLTLYSLRKFARLAAAGNPSILNLFFAPVVKQSRLGADVRCNADIFVSKAAGPRYLGYMKNQRERLLGLRGQKSVKRPELEEAYGFDTKYAYHILRLAIQGIELMETGRISIPMSEPYRTTMVDVRTGRYDQDWCLAYAADLEANLKHAIDSSDLYDKPDIDGIDSLLVEWHETHWSTG